jgi:hypothetical protein
MTKIADEVARFSTLNNNIKQELMKKKGLTDHKADAERDLRKAIE